MKLKILALVSFALMGSAHGALAQCVDCAIYPDRDHLNGSAVTPAGKTGLQRSYGAASSLSSDALAGVRDQYLQAPDTHVTRQKKRTPHR
jgi:hypothetical protein